MAEGHDDGVVTLLGMEQSAYTGKAHGYLRYKGLPLRLVTASADVYRHVILPNVGWAVVPVAIDSDGTVIQDTTVIIDYFEKKFPNDRSVIPSSPCQKLVARILEIFGDQWFLLPGMHFRWNFPEQLEFLVHEWDRAGNPEGHANSTPEDLEKRLQLARRNMKQFSGMLPGLGISPATIPGIEETYRNFLDAMAIHLRKHRYLLGNAPCVGDFGLITFLYAHLYRDPVPGKMMKENYPEVAEYVERVRGFVYPGAEQKASYDPSQHKFTSEPVGQAGFLPDDQIPETLGPILELFFKEHMPMLLHTVEALREYIRANPDMLGNELPRGLGKSEFQVGGCKGIRAIQTFEAWKLQRVVDACNSDAAACREFLSRFGDQAIALANIDFEPHRLIKPVGLHRKSTIYLEKHLHKATL
mmetsp:Transcript_10939/g.21413  ORF Transcript_10939/g.21413 Transcript_10939/m.21413 type:complete len:414 (-) Transcript_10939:137-1378(-)